MDPMTHVVIGRAIVAAARDDTRNRAIGAAGILGALSPDVDSAVALSGWDRYIRVHQVGTHTPLGALLLALLTALVVHRSAAAFARRSARRRRGAAEAAARHGASRRAIAAAALAGAFSHLAIDLASGARIALTWPLGDRTIALPLVAMLDPSLIAICVTGVLLVWPLRVRLRTAGRAVVIATTLFLGAKAVLLATALLRTDAAPSAPRAIEAKWASLSGWYLFDRTPDAVRARVITVAGGTPAPYLLRPVARESPLVRASRDLEAVRNFVAVHEFAFAEQTARVHGEVAVLWSDLRYCSPADGASPSAGRCGVWVGGVFDAGGRAIAQEVHVGSVVQRRDP